VESAVHPGVMIKLFLSGNLSKAFTPKPARLSCANPTESSPALAKGTADWPANICSSFAKNGNAWLVSSADSSDNGAAR